MGRKHWEKELGEIARYEQFLLFPQCFQKACFPGASKGVVVWEWVKIKQHKTYNLISYLHYPLQSPKNPLVRSYLRIQNGQGQVIFLTLSSSRKSDNESDFIFLNCLFLCTGHTKYRAGIQILMGCNPDLH